MPIAPSLYFELAMKTRRQLFLAAIAATASTIAIAKGRTTQPPAPEPSATPIPEIARTSPPVPLPTRILGRTNENVPILGLGGSASPLSRSSEEKEAIAIIERAIELGIRYFDTAANYGPSEDFLGRALGDRSDVFVASKTSSRTYDDAWRQLERSLTRLRRDRLDLWQFHALTYDWDLDTILQPRQGAIRAAHEAKEQGLIRYLGVTGHHNPGIIAKAIERHPFDTALIPINAADKHTPAPFIDRVLPVARQANTGIIAMKVPAYGRLLKPGVLNGMQEAIAYALSQEGAHCCIIAAETVAQLEENVRAASAFETLSASALAAIEQRTASVWRESSFFRRWG